jgi:hypothetical protein
MHNQHMPQTTAVAPPVIKSHICRLLMPGGHRYITETGEPAQRAGAVPARHDTPISGTLPAEPDWLSLT